MIEVASRGDLTAVEQYQIRGANLNAGDYDLRMPLHLACAEGNVNVVDFLLAHGADVNAKDRWGSTPLNDAIRNGHKAVIEILKKYGGIEGANDYLQISAELPVSVTSDVTAFIWAASMGNLQAMLPYVARGMALNCADYDARTALHLAASEGRTDVVKYLLAYSVDLVPRDRWGNTLLDDAIWHGHKDVAALLEKLQPAKKKRVLAAA